MEESVWSIHCRNFLMHPEGHFYAISHGPYVASFFLVTRMKIVVSARSGPGELLFGGGNSPAFVVVAIVALTSTLIAILAIPRSTVQKPRALP